MTEQAKRVKRAIRKVLGMNVSVRTERNWKRDRSTGLRYVEFGDADSASFDATDISIEKLFELACEAYGTVFVFRGRAFLSSAYSSKVGPRVIETKIVDGIARQTCLRSH